MTYATFLCYYSEEGMTTHSFMSSLVKIDSKKTKFKYLYPNFKEVRGWVRFSRDNTTAMKVLETFYI